MLTIYKSSKLILFTNVWKNLVQLNLGLRVTWFASVLQDEQKFLRNFDLINEQCFAIRVEVVCLCVCVCVGFVVCVCVYVCVFCNVWVCVGVWVL
jgi:hypothetical protein